MATEIVDIDPTNPKFVQGVRDFMEEALTLSADYGEQVCEAVALAAAEPLDEARARGLFTRILSILRGVERDDLDDDDRARLVDQVRREAEELVQAVPRPRSDGPRLNSDGGLQLVERRGLTPHPVKPVPTFNGTPIPMQEGYVDVETLPLWPENHRIELHIQEFRERNQREPSQDELEKLLQGKISLPSLDKKDPFELMPLAKSIARKGVDRPPIVTWEGTPKDGNRRIAAAKYVVEHPELFSPEEQERARWIRVWQMPRETTKDEVEDVVFSLNFEDDYKIKWPEYVKARLVVGRYDQVREGVKGRFTSQQDRDIKKQVAEQYAIGVSEVSRYIKMVRWAEDFEEYHAADEEKDAAKIRYRSNDIFQWFYEIEAGRGEEKLTQQLIADDNLKGIVYDLMYDVLDAGHEVRNLYRVVADKESLDMLEKAHAISTGGDKKGALDLVKNAIEVAQRKSPTKRKLGFEDWLRTAVERLGPTPPDQWRELDTDLLLEVQRVFKAAVGAIDGELAARQTTAAKSAA